jgi:very-short-patch-repair endonuclease
MARKKKTKRLAGSVEKEKALIVVGKKYAKELKDKATYYELEFQKILHQVGEPFIFQHPVVCEQNYLYILDFYIPKYNIAIELDGAQHYTKQGKKKDKQRTKKLEKLGIAVKRICNYNVKLVTTKMLLEYFGRLQLLINVKS